MPTVDINGPSQTSSGSKEGFGTGIPTPLLLLAVGGGLGLIVFMMRKSGDSEGEAEDGYLLPNTNIMLGSLQQGILELMGKVTQGNADLSSQLSGVGANLALQLDTQTAQIAEGFAQSNANFTTLSGSIQGQYDALSSVMAGLGTQNEGLAAQISTALAGLMNLKTDMSTVIGNQNLSAAQVGALGAEFAAKYAGLSTQISGISGQISNLPAPVAPAAPATSSSWLAWNGSKFYASNGVGYSVIGGKIYGYDDQPTFDGTQANYRGWIGLSSTQIQALPEWSGVIL